MTYEEFSKLLDKYKEINEDISELYDIGVNILDGKYSISDKICNMFDIIIESNFNEYGVDWINWFICENDYGKKDWSLYKTIDSENKIVDKGDKSKYGAFDADGTPICYDYESLWSYIQQYKK